MRKYGKQSGARTVHDSANQRLGARPELFAQTNSRNQILGLNNIENIFYFLWIPETTNHFIEEIISLDNGAKDTFWA